MGPILARVSLHCDRYGYGEPSLVLVHGFTQTGRSWSPITEQLARHHRVTVVDAPGHGRSSTIRASIADGAALIGDAGGRAVYVGYSMGGRLCLDLALARPDLVHGLVLVNTTAGIDDADERLARRHADDKLAADLERDGLEPFLDRWLAGPLFTTLPSAAAGRADRMTNTVAGLAASLRLAGTGTAAPRWEELAAITAPTLVVVGSLDTKFAPLGARIASEIGRSCTLVRIDGAGHTAHLEQPQEFLSVLSTWLEASFT